MSDFDTNDAVLFLAKQAARKMDRCPTTIMTALVYKMNPCSPASTEAVAKVINITINEMADSRNVPDCDHAFQWAWPMAGLQCAKCKKEWPL
jgi:hypothetical protein